MPELAVIADDLTGSSDTGVQFCKFGLRTQVLLEPSFSESVRQSDVIVMDTASRAAPPAHAEARVREACRIFHQIDVPNLYKKIDSTLRGNLGVEICAACDEFKPTVTVIAPAFPQNGRNTVGGVQLLNGVPVSRTEISRDPKTPVREAYLPRLLASYAGERVGVVPLQVVMDGTSCIEGFMHDLTEAGRTWLVCDAASEQDLRHIAEAALSFGKVLWVGSAGLAEQIPEVNGWGRVSKQANEYDLVACKAALTVSGSVSAVTQKQIMQYVEEDGAHPIWLDAVAAVQSPELEAQRLVAAALSLLGRKKLILSCANDRSIVDAAQAACKDAGWDTDRAGERIAMTLGIAVTELVRQGSDGLFLTGGETAVSCCRALGASGLEICREVLPGIPMCRLLGGEFEGLPIVTKAGAFGAENAITLSVAALQEKQIRKN